MHSSTTIKSIPFQYLQQLLTCMHPLRLVSNQLFINPSKLQLKCLQGDTNLDSFLKSLEVSLCSSWSRDTLKAVSLLVVLEWWALTEWCRKSGFVGMLTWCWLAKSECDIKGTCKGCLEKQPMPPTSVISVIWFSMISCNTCKAQSKCYKCKQNSRNKPTIAWFTEV